VKKSPNQKISAAFDETAKKQTTKKGENKAAKPMPIWVDGPRLKRRNFQRWTWGEG